MCFMLLPFLFSYSDCREKDSLITQYISNKHSRRFISDSTRRNLLLKELIMKWKSSSRVSLSLLSWQCKLFTLSVSLSLSISIYPLHSKRDEVDMRGSKVGTESTKGRMTFCDSRSVREEEKKTVRSSLKGISSGRNGWKRKEMNNNSPPRFTR